MKKNGFNKKGLCRLCKEPRTEDGHDPCMANLPGVIYACCGHGLEHGYLKFEDGRCLRFMPLSVDLDEPMHEVVERVPIFHKNESHRVLNLENGKVKVEIEQLAILETRTTSVVIRKK